MRHQCLRQRGSSYFAAIALDGETASFTATTSAHKVPVDNLELAVMLPGGFTYSPNSAKRDGQTINDPEIIDGRLIFRFHDLPADQTTLFSSLPSHGSASSGELPAKASFLSTRHPPRATHAPAETRFHLTKADWTHRRDKTLPSFP